MPQLLQQVLCRALLSPLWMTAAFVVFEKVFLELGLAGLGRRRGVFKRIAVAVLTD